MHRVGGASPCPFPRPTAGSGGGAASPPASPGGGAWFGKIFVSHKNKTSARPFPHDRAGAGVPQAAWEGVRAQEQVAARQLSLRPPRLAGLPTRPRAGACVSDGGGGGRGRPGLPRAQAAWRPLPTPHLAIVLALVKWKAKETRMERQRTRRSGQGRDDASGRGAGRPPPAAPQPAARPRGRTDTYCICQVFASYPTPAVHRWKTEPPPTQRARGLGREGGVAGRGAGGTRTLSQGVTSRRGAPAGAGAAGEHREWPAGAAAGAGGWGPLPCDFAVSSVFFFLFFF